jgi:Na+/serine symporter
VVNLSGLSVLTSSSVFIRAPEPKEEHMERSTGIMRLLVAATVAGMLLLAMVIVAVIVTVRFRRNPRGNTCHLRR